MKKPVLPDWPRMLRRENAAAYIDVSPGTFDRLVQNGDIPAPLTFPRSTVKAWDRHDLDGFVQSLRDGATSNNEWDQ